MKFKDSESKDDVPINNGSLGNIMMVYGRCVLYGVDQTRFFQKAMINRNHFTMLVLPKKINQPSPIMMDIDKRVVSDNASIMDSHSAALRTQYDFSDIPILFFPASYFQNIVAASGISEFIEDENKIVAYRKVPTDDMEIKKFMKKRCPMNQVTVMFKKDAYDRAGGYRDWYCEEDYYLWLRMAGKGAVFANTGTVLVNVRVGGEMYKRRGGLKYFKSEAKLQIYMWKHRFIGFWRCTLNIFLRFIVQVLLPNNMRGWVFRKFARGENS